MELELSRQAFWDIDPASIKGREDIYALWIIKRVAQYGTVEDMVSIDVFYGRDKLIKVLKSMSVTEQSKSKLMNTFVF